MVELLQLFKSMTCLDLKLALRRLGAIRESAKEWAFAPAPLARFLKLVEIEAIRLAEASIKWVVPDEIANLLLLVV
jgi:hypothetical protein